MNACRNPAARTCKCVSCADDQSALDNLRDRVQYDGLMNSIGSWLLTERWTTPAESTKIRGMCVTRTLTIPRFSEMPPRALTKFVANGAVSGEIPWK